MKYVYFFNVIKLAGGLIGEKDGTYLQRRKRVARKTVI